MHIVDDILSVDGLCNIVSNRLSAYDTIEALILIGSCSRGEETYYVNSRTNKCLYSDIEFFAVLRNKNQIQKINEEVSDINRELKSISESPIFEVSVGYLFLNSIKRMDRRLIIFETKECGKVIFGNENVLNSLPVITVNNINKSNLVSIINQRLFHVLIEWNKLSELERKYCIARNTLDIPTVYLPFIGHLISSYKERNKFLVDSNDWIEDTFPKDFIQRLNFYLEMKLDLSCNIYSKFNSKEMLSLFCADMECLLGIIKKIQGFVFLRDKHRMMRAAIHLRFNELRFELNRPSVERQLCNTMMECLKNGEWNEEDESKASNLMKELYKKR